MNKNYVKGRRKEYKICNSLKNKEFNIVQRTAGSHSPVDIIAINKKENLILLIQSKPDNLSNKEIERLINKFNWLNNRWTVKFIVL